MAPPTKELLVNAFYCASPSQAWSGLWTHPRSNGKDYNRIQYWTDLARNCEAGLFDCIFIADGMAIAQTYENSPSAMLRSGSYTPALDPMLVIPPMAMVTQNLVFGVTGNVTYEPAYSFARRLSSLDHLTGGRVAWNVVTGIHESAARAFGLKGLPEHDERYRAADEYMEVVYALWEGCWADDAVVRDFSSRIFTDPHKVRAIKHEGKHYQCEGIHLTEPSPQRTPLIFSAGSSAAGSDFGGKHSECIFIATGNKAAVKKAVREIRQKAVAHGRDPYDVRVLLAMTVIVAPTEAEARELHRDYEDHVDRIGILAMRAGLLGIDFSKFDMDDPIPGRKTNASQGSLDNMRARENIPRIRDLCEFSPVHDAFLIGSPQQVCDEIMDWVHETDIDGINLMRTVEPEWIRDFGDLVVPELQNRKAFKTAYRPGTAREKFFPSTSARVNARHPAASFRYAAQGS
jgi:FMN-dependent oxidoreductase (nitrilotriacetate monooxygenase family)